MKTGLSTPHISVLPGVSSYAAHCISGAPLWNKQWLLKGSFGGGFYSLHLQLYFFCANRNDWHPSSVRSVHSWKGDFNQNHFPLPLSTVAPLPLWRTSGPCWSSWRHGTTCKTGLLLLYLPPGHQCSITGLPKFFFNSAFPSEFNVVASVMVLDHLKCGDFFFLCPVEFPLLVSCVCQPLPLGCVTLGTGPISIKPL